MSHKHSVSGDIVSACKTFAILLYVKRYSCPPLQSISLFCKKSDQSPINIFNRLIISIFYRKTNY